MQEITKYLSNDGEEFETEEECLEHERQYDSKTLEIAGVKFIVDYGSTYKIKTFFEIYQDQSEENIVAIYFPNFTKILYHNLGEIWDNYFEYVTNPCDNVCFYNNKVNKSLLLHLDTDTEEWDDFYEKYDYLKELKNKIENIL